MTRAEMCGVFIPEWLRQGSGRASRVESDQTGRVDAQQVVVIHHSPASEDGTDRGFRNVGF